MDIYRSITGSNTPDPSTKPGEFTSRRESLDLMSLSGTKDSAALEILEMTLEKKTLPVRIIVTEQQNQVLWHLYSEQRSQERLKGYRPLGLGYPLILSPGEENTQYIPVFIWPLRIEPSLYRANEWEIYSSTADPCRINPQLWDWLGQPDAADWPVQVSAQPGRAEVSQFIQTLITARNLESSSQSLAITPLPKPEEVKSWTAARLLWSGLISTYPERVVDMITAPDLQPEERAPAGYPYGLLNQDPYQASAVASARKNSLSWVEGISGTGKTHVLTQIVSMALTNGQKCLVVSPSASNLKEIQDKLAASGIQRLAYLIRNPEAETGMLLDFFRAMAEGAYLPPDLDATQFNLYLDRCEREKHKLDERYQAVRQPVFGEYDWTETVGIFLESNRKVGKELLGMQLYTQDFEFTHPEFQVLSLAIKQSQPLYQKVNTLKHPLNNLHPDIFLNMEKEEGRVRIADRLEVFHGKATRLQRRYFSKVNQYGEALRKHFDQHYQELSIIVHAIKDKMAEGKNRFGQTFEESSERKLRLYGLFSKKQKEILQARIQIEERYDELKQKFDLFGYFDFELPPAGSKPVEQLRPYVLLFEEALTKWQHKHASIIQDNIQRLSRKTVHPRLHMQEEIEELEDNLNLLLETLNEAQLYEQPFEHNMLTIPKRQKYLEGVIEQLEETKRYLPDYVNFYDWQRNWLNLSQPARKLVRALVKVKPTDWEAAFKSWYLHHCLNLAHTPKLPQVDDGLGAFVQAFRQLQSLLLPSISRLWDQRRTEAVRRLKTVQKKNYQLLFTPAHETPNDPQLIQKKWQQGLEIISEVLPVLLISESVIPYLPREQGKIYDYILVDEAHLLSGVQLAHLHQLGHHLVALSDPSLEHMSRERSWTNQWREQGIPSTLLKNIYHWRPGNLLQLTGENTVLAPASQIYSVFFEQVEGRYEEQSQMNSAEAETLITLLNRIEKTPQRTYPTVGIVCMTRGQRNLIQQLLFQIKKQDAAGADTIRQLERNGLGVYSIDEIAGIHFDILIFSGAWGAANSRGDLTEDLTLLDRPESLALLNLLMGRAYQSVYALNSIPFEDLEKMSRDKTHAGRFWYANYIRYLDALAGEDASLQQEIVQQMRDLYPKADTLQQSVFCEEVVQELGLYLRNQQLFTNYEEARLRFPIVVQSKEENGRPIVVQPDAFIAKSPATDYSWEYEQRKQLAELGYSFLPAWSVKWWREPALEAKRLASIILNILEEEETSEEAAAPEDTES